jgi:subtilisin family serine protease
MKKRFFAVLFIIICLTAAAFSRPSDFPFVKNSDFGGSDALYAMLKEERISSADKNDGYNAYANSQGYTSALNTESGNYANSQGYTSALNTESGDYANTKNYASALNAENNNYVYTNAQSYTSDADNAENGVNYPLSDEKFKNGAVYNSISKRLIVKAEGKVDSFGAAFSARIGDFYIFQYAEIKQAENAYARLSAQKNVSAVEFDAAFSLSATTADENDAAKTSSVGTTATGLPAYTYMSWGAGATGADVFSSYLVASYGLENLPEIIVAIVDSGVDALHPVFSGRIADGGKNFSTSEASSAVEYKDDNGHGTHVSGIIADLTLPNVKILPLKVINTTGAASVTSIIAALTYLSELKAAGLNVRAVNMSLSGALSQTGALFALYKSVLENIYRQNILPVGAAGNDGKDAAGYAPGNIGCVLTVSALKENRDGSLEFDSSYSNFGTLVDFAAPGSSITSAYLNGGTIALSGTSMASPHAAAIVALLYSDPKNYAMSANQAEAYLRNIAVDLGATGKDTKYGYGFINTGYIPSYTAPYTPQNPAPADGDAQQNDGQDEISGGSAVVVPPKNIAENTENNANDQIAVAKNAPFAATALVALLAAFYVFASRASAKRN